MVGKPVGACVMLSSILGRFWPFVGVYSQECLIGLRLNVRWM